MVYIKKKFDNTIEKSLLLFYDIYKYNKKYIYCILPYFRCINYDSEIKMKLCLPRHDKLITNNSTIYYHLTKVVARHVNKNKNPLIILIYEIPFEFLNELNNQSDNQLDNQLDNHIEYNLIVNYENQEYDIKINDIDLFLNGIPTTTLGITTLFKSDYKILPTYINYYLQQGVGLFFLYYNDVISNELISFLNDKLINLDANIRQKLIFIEWNMEYFLDDYLTKINKTPSIYYAPYAQTGQINHALWMFGKTKTHYLIFNDLDEYLFIGDGNRNTSTSLDTIKNYSNKLIFFIFEQIICDNQFNPNTNELPIVSCNKNQKYFKYPIRGKCIYDTHKINLVDVHHPCSNYYRSCIKLGYFWHFNTWSKST